MKTELFAILDMKDNNWFMASPTLQMLLQMAEKRGIVIKKVQRLGELDIDDESIKDLKMDKLINASNVMRNSLVVLKEALEHRRTELDELKERNSFLIYRANDVRNEAEKLWLQLMRNEIKQPSVIWRRKYRTMEIIVPFKNEMENLADSIKQYDAARKEKTNDVTIR